MTATVLEREPEVKETSTDEPEYQHAFCTLDNNITPMELLFGRPRVVTTLCGKRISSDYGSGLPRCPKCEKLMEIHHHD